MLLTGSWENTPKRQLDMAAGHRRVTGDQYDFFSIDFDYGNGVSSHSMCRQIDSCANGTGEIINGNRRIYQLPEYNLGPERKC